MTTEQQDITAVILAGGQARRMGGQDKGLVRFRDRPMVEWAIDAIAPQVQRILVNANRNLDYYRGLGHPVVSDRLPDYPGPLAGMAAAMEQQGDDLLLILPCDGPFPAPDLAARLRQGLLAADAEIAVAHDGEWLQPVYALMRPGLQASLAAYLASDQHKIDRWYRQHRMVTVDLSDRPECFLNINSPEELERIEQLQDE